VSRGQDHLADALAAVGVTAQPAPASPAPPEPPAGPPRRRASRQGKRAVGAHIPPELHRALRVLAAEEGTTVNDLLTEGIRMVLRRRQRRGRARRDA